MRCVAAWAFGAALAALATAALAQPPPSGVYATPTFAKLPDGRRLAFYCEGSGAPAVIFDSGAGGIARTWSRVQPEIAKTNRTCSYDRAGYDVSDPGPMPRSARRVVADLHDGLAALGIRPPYVLVAHSLGGFHARLFANLHREELAGMVLVDPSNDGGFALLIAASPSFAKMIADDDQGGPCIWAIAEGRMKPGTPMYAQCGSPPVDSYLASPTMAQAVLSEAASQVASTAEIAASRRSYGDLPLVILSHDPKGDMSQAWPAAERDAYWKAVLDDYRAMAALSTRGVERRVEGSNHGIQVSKPEAVAAAIREVLAQAK